MLKAFILVRPAPLSAQLREIGMVVAPVPPRTRPRMRPLTLPVFVQTIEFTPGHRGLLHTRTSDGLPLTLGLSFQYRYIPTMLHELWLKYQGKQVRL